MYRKLLSMFLVIVIAFSLVACAKPGSTQQNPNNDPATTQAGNNNENQPPEEVKKPVEYTTYAEVYSSELSTLNYFEHDSDGRCCFGRPLR